MLKTSKHLLSDSVKFIQEEILFNLRFPNCSHTSGEAAPCDLSADVRTGNCLKFTEAGVPTNGINKNIKEHNACHSIL